MATRKTIEKIMRNGVPYYLWYDSKITINANWTKVDDFTLNQNADQVINLTLPTNSDFVDLTTAQTIGGVKTFTSAPVVPSKTTDATNSWTAVATEAQVYKKQDSLTLPTTPTSWHLVTWGANNKTLADWWAIPLWVPSWGTAWQLLTKKSDWYGWEDAPETYSEITKNDLDTGTWTTAWVLAAKTIADYVSGRIGSAVNYKWQVTSYSDLPATPNTWDMYNVVNAHTTAPKFDAWTNVVWNGTNWDPMAEMVDLSNLVDKTTNQTIGWTKTFSVSPVVPNKTSAATNNWTAIATEAQVKNVADSIKDSTVSVTQAGESAWSFSVNQSSNSTLALTWNLLKTDTEYTNLPSSKNTDWNWYFIYAEAEVA